MKIDIIAGARPNFIKIAPLCKEFAKQENHINHRHLVQFVPGVINGWYD